MKANELRIGNWVEQPNDGVTRVTAILNDLQIKTETGYIDKYCRPIPLTEEILLKCGFRKLDKYTFVKNKWFVYKRKRGFVTASKQREVKFDYVHLLQNWYYFNTNGEELEIQL